MGRFVCRVLSLAVVSLTALSLFAWRADAATTTVQASKAWVDFNGDGRDDFCRLVGNTYLQCTVSTGSGFGGTYTSYSIDPGQAAGRAWVDFNGDRRADYCRVVGGNFLRCTLSSGTGFGSSYQSTYVDPGYDAGRAWTDHNADGKADYCRVVGGWGTSAQCTLSTGYGFAGTYTSASLDAGYDKGRGWADANGDGRADYCRIVGSFSKYADCTVSNGAGFGATMMSWPSLDPGYDATRVWVDFNGDRMADFCRVVENYKFSCRMSNGSSFATEVTSGMVDPGYDAGRAWVDFNRDGKTDVCRVVGGWDKFLQCTVSTGSGFGATYSSGAVDPGYDTGRAWADFSGDGQADYCRVVGGWHKYLQCTVSTGSGFGWTSTSGAVDPGWD